jgi:hypothetical protein
MYSDEPAAKRLRTSGGGARQPQPQQPQPQQPTMQYQNPVFEALNDCDEGHRQRAAAVQDARQQHQQYQYYQQQHQQRVAEMMEYVSQFGAISTGDRTALDEESRDKLERRVYTVIVQNIQGIRMKMQSFDDLEVEIRIGRQSRSGFDASVCDQAVFYFFVGLVD